MSVIGIPVISGPGFTLQDLVDKTRRTLDDEAEGIDANRFWYTSDLEGYLNEAQNIFATRTLCLRSSLDDSICLKQLTIGERHYLLSEKVLKIDEIYPSWNTIPMVNSPGGYRRFENGWLKAEGYPTKYAVDYEQGYLTLNKAIKIIGCNVRMTVRRLPHLMTGIQGPEIREEYRHLLVEYALYRAYDRQDSEIYNPKKSSEKLSLWESKLVEAQGQMRRLFPPITTKRTISEF